MLGEVAGGGTYENLVANSTWIEIDGLRVRCATLDQLIFLKNAAGRPKDLSLLPSFGQSKRNRKNNEDEEEDFQKPLGIFVISAFFVAISVFQ